MAILGILAIFFHYIFIGPKLPQPEPPPAKAAGDEAKPMREG
jgi:hypothetical protein